MKRNLFAVLLIGAFAASPAFASTLNQQPETRAQVKAELSQESAAGKSLPIEGQLLPIEDYSANVMVIRKSESESRPVHIFAWMHRKSATTTE